MSLRLPYRRCRTDKECKHATGPSDFGIGSTDGIFPILSSQFHLEYSKAAVFGLLLRCRKCVDAGACISADGVQCRCSGTESAVRGRQALPSTGVTSWRLLVEESSSFDFFGICSNTLTLFRQASACEDKRTDVKVTLAMEQTTRFVWRSICIACRGSGCRCGWP